MKRLFLFSLSVLVATLSFSQPKNIILIMADGMGFNHANIITSSSSKLNDYDINYAVCNYPTYWETLDKEKKVEFYRGDYHVRRVWEEFSYADSLPIDALTAGSALATGVKPAFDAVSYDMNEKELETILERAIKKGKSTGLATDTKLVSNNAILPFIAHANVANNEEAYKNLVSQLFSSNINVVVAAEELKEITTGTWDIANAIEDFPTTLEKNVFFGKESLTNSDYCTISKKGLDALATNENGFLFVSEFSKIARAAEQQDVDATTTAMNDFNTYISEIYSWIENNSSWDETLMIVVGSYEQGYATSKSFNKKKPVENYISKNASDFQYNSNHATNLLTPMYAKGNSSDIFSNYIDETDFVLGSYISNTEIAHAIFRLMPNKINAPKNIILMINDGCGIAPITMAEYYTGEPAPFRDFPIQVWNNTHASVSTSIVTSLKNWNNTYESRLAWTGKDYFWARKNATCSGASGTAIATGKKTYYYSLGVDIKKNALKSIARYAKDMGKAAGVATNAPYNDATPGAFFTNNVDRLNSGELARQVIIESNADVIIGCNHPEYDIHAQKLTEPDYSSIGGIEMLEGLRNNATEFAVASNSGWTQVRDIDGDGTPDPWTFVEDSAGLVQYLHGENTPKRLFGLMPVDGSMQFYRTGINPQEVHFDDWNKGMPRLWQIGMTAINCLSKNENGFFLMIEGDMVDNAGHKNQRGRHIEEQMEFNQTVDSVIAWIEKYSSWDETLLIITADHETGFVADPYLKEDSILLNHWQIIDKGIGNVPDLEYYSLDHTNQLVPLFAKGAGSEVLATYADEWDFVRGKFMNNSEIGQSMFELWDGKACQFVNEAPKCVFTDTLYIKQSTEFSIEIPSDIVYDKEEGYLPFKLQGRPSWAQYDEETRILSGKTLKSTGVTFVTFTATDGNTSGAAITLLFTIKICTYKDTLPSSVENIYEPQSNVYPTIALSQITVHSETGNGKIIVRNIQGRTIAVKPIQGEETIISTDNFAPGEYLIQIVENENVTTKKIIVR